MTVLKRAPPYTNEFDTVELRIGNVDMTGSRPVQFTENPLAGTYGSSNAVEVIFDVNPPMNGRYLTLQTLVVQWFSIDEIYAKRLLQPDTSTNPTGNNITFGAIHYKVTFMDGKSKPF